MSIFSKFATLAVSAGLTFGTAFASQIDLTGVAGFPNGRPAYQGDTPENAIDGNINTYTWTTASFTTSPAYLAISFDATDVNRIRLWKDKDGGGGLNFKDLVIEYTTDTNADLSARTYTAVSGLASGFLGDELFHATNVNSNGTVIGDVHYSVADGWGSLTFSAVNATGIAIAFSTTGGNFNHYRVGEFQAYYNEELNQAPEPGTILLFTSALGAVVFARPRR